MKKGILVFVALLIVSVTQATNSKRVNTSFNNTISFVEKGIRFHVFLNGDFDFDRRRVRRRVGFNRIKIRYDYRGRIRRVGNALINYDVRGKVSRIGNIKMLYRRNRLIRVGNLKILYNRRGGVTFFGRVRYNDFYNNNYQYSQNVIYDFDSQFFYRRNFNNLYSQYREDNNFLYYKARQDDGNVKKGTVVKRKKRNNNIIDRKRKSETTVNTRSRD